MSADFVAWLEDRLAEDERQVLLLCEHLDGHERPYDPLDPTDPARVLADIESKRQIIGLYGHAVVSGSFGHDPTHFGAATMGFAVLQHLATVYAGHPGYRNEWSP